MMEKIVSLRACRYGTRAAMSLRPLVPFLLRAGNRGRVCAGPPSPPDLASNAPRRGLPPALLGQPPEPGLLRLCGAIERIGVGK
jgi:hypothetical protein